MNPPSHQHPFPLREIVALALLTPWELAATEPGAADQPESALEFTADDRPAQPWHQFLRTEFDPNTVNQGPLDFTAPGLADSNSPGYDRTKFPSTTSTFRSLHNKAQTGDVIQRSGHTLAVRAEAPDGTGVFLLSTNAAQGTGRASPQAVKTWFCFGDTVVCLGTNIRNSITASETGTTLFQDRWNPQEGRTEDTTKQLNWNGESRIDRFPFEQSQALITPEWLINRQGLGFYLYAGQQLTLHRTEQQALSADNRTMRKGLFTTAWLSHGHAPTNSAYRYLMRIDASPASMLALEKAMCRNAPYQINQQDETAHIVGSKPHATTGYVIFRPDTPLNDGLVLSASRPCVLLMQQGESNLTLSVADQDLNRMNEDAASNRTTQIKLTLQGTWDVESASSPAFTDRQPAKTVITIRCQNGLTSTVRMILRSQ